MDESFDSLARRCGRGDRDACARLSEALHPQVEGHVVSLLNRYGFGYLIDGHLQDIVNYVWRDLLENISRYERGDFRLWFAYRRVRRVLDYLRKEVKHIPVAHDETLDPGPTAATSGNPETELLRARIRDGIQELPTQQALVLKLLYWDGLSYREIADLLGKSSNSIGSIHTRALRRLKATMKKTHGTMN